MQSYNDREQSSGCLLVREDGLERDTRELLAVKERVCVMTVEVATQLNAFVKTHQTVHLKLMNFIVCKLYFTKVDPPKD